MIGQPENDPFGVGKCTHHETPMLRHRIYERMLLPNGRMVDGIEFSNAATFIRANRDGDGAMIGIALHDDASSSAFTNFMDPDGAEFMAQSLMKLAALLRERAEDDAKQALARAALGTGRSDAGGAA